MAFLLILFSPECSASTPIVPQVTVTLYPMSMNATSPADRNITLSINGTVTMNKLPLERIVVSLIPSIDAGWPSSCSPSSIVITDETSHPFKCDVIVPQATPNMTAILTVEAQARGGGFVVTDWANATIMIKGTALTNKTGSNQTSTGGAQTSQGGRSVLGGINVTSLSVLGVLLVAAVAGCGIYFYKKRRNARRKSPD